MAAPMLSIFSDLWVWVGSLTPASASFLGTLTGSSLGLLAILIGALFNAHLNRKRDDRLRKDEARSVRSALKAELLGIQESLTRNAETVATADFVVPDIAHSVRVMPALLPKLGLLDVETTREVIGIYVSIDQFCENLILLGGHIAPNNRADRRLIAMPARRAEAFANMSRRLAEMVRKVIVGLDKDVT
jgi:hypothetical protein